MSTAAVDLQTASLRPFEPTNLNGLLAESIGVAGDVVLVGGFSESPVMAWMPPPERSWIGGRSARVATG